MGFNRYLFSAVGISFLVLLVFGILKWMSVPTGAFLDWIIGVAGFWWLLIIVTLPWNMYFKAREVLEEAAWSRKKEIPVEEKEVAYVKNLARRSLWAALGLHLLSAVGLYALSVFEISALGYIGAGAALLLTGLRPAVRAHEYVVDRLTAIRKKFRYPRQDVVELRSRQEKLAEDVRLLKKLLDTEEKESLVSNIFRNQESMSARLEKVRIMVENLGAANQAAHENLAREARQAISQITEDGRFLEQVREIIRFVKNA